MAADETGRDDGAETGGPVAVARAGPYLVVRSRDPSGDVHADLFELRSGPVHIASFSGNKGLPESAAEAELASLLGRATRLEWHAVPAPRNA